MSSIVSRRLRVAGDRRRRRQRVCLDAQGPTPRARCLVVVNFTPNVCHDYRVRVPFAGTWREVLNTDSAHYGGSNVGNAGVFRTLDACKPELSYPPAAGRHLSRS